MTYTPKVTYSICFLALLKLDYQTFDHKQSQETTIIKYNGPVYNTTHFLMIQKGDNYNRGIPSLTLCNKMYFKQLTFNSKCFVLLKIKKIIFN
jgi:hypothetical protein